MSVRLPQRPTKLNYKSAPRCPDCESLNIYVRIKSNEAVCRRCGSIFDLDDKVKAND